MWLRHPGRLHWLAKALKFKQSHLKLAAGHSFYVFICVPFKRKRSLLTGETSFNPQGHQWRLTAVLRPSQLRTQQTYLCLKQSPAAMELQRGDHHQVSIKNLPMVSEVFGATSSPYAEGEGTNMFSVHTVFMETHTFS